MTWTWCCWIRPVDGDWITWRCPVAEVLDERDAWALLLLEHGQVGLEVSQWWIEGPEGELPPQHLQGRYA